MVMVEEHISVPSKWWQWKNGSTDGGVELL